MLSGFAVAQVPGDWGGFFQRVDVSAYQGCRFKATAAVRAMTMEETAGAEIFVRILKSDWSNGFFYNMMDKPIRKNQWQVYSIEGKIDKDSHYLLLGGLYQRRGYFFFDNFHLQVETKGSEWKDLPLSDNGFELDTLPVNSAWLILQKRPFFTLSISHDQPFEGGSSIRVDGSKFGSTFSYGHNDTAGKYAEVNGVRLYYETYGHGQPLLLLHGNSQSIASFSKQIPDLSQNHMVIAIDTRGHGNSSGNGETYTYDLFAKDMDALLDNLHLDSVDVLGWSDGGNTGLIMAMKYPARVHKLAVMGANIYIDSTVVDPWVFDTLRSQQRELANDTSYYARNRERLMTLLLTEPQYKFQDLHAISCPVLVMAGEKDIIREQHTRGIAANIKNSRLTIFPDGTHNEPLDHPDLFNKTVLDFFNP